MQDLSLKARAGNVQRIEVNRALTEHWGPKPGMLNSVFKTKWFTIRRRSPKGHKLGSHRSRMGNEMKKEIKAKGSKPRIADVTGELELGLLALS